MKNISFGIKYIIGRQIFKKHIPLIAGLAITNKCNLRCRHCRVIERKTEDMSFEKITSILDSFYKEGGRTVYLEGGEPFIWNNNQYNLENIVEYAHKKGFYTVKKEPVKHKEIIIESYTMIKNFKSLQFEHIYSHEGEIYNEMCDKLAKQYTI